MAEEQPSESTNNEVYDPHLHRVTYKPVSYVYSRQVVCLILIFTNITFEENVA